MSEQIKQTPKAVQLDTHLSSFTDIYAGLTTIHQWEDQHGHFREMLGADGTIHTFHVGDTGINETIRTLEEHQQLLQMIEEDFNL